MTAFAVRYFFPSRHATVQIDFIQTGGLLSDVFLHLIPHSFMGEHQGPGVHFVMVEEKRNILIGYVLTNLIKSNLHTDPGWEYSSDSRHSFSWKRRFVYSETRRDLQATLTPIPILMSKPQQYRHLGSILRPPKTASVPGGPRNQILGVARLNLLSQTMDPPSYRHI